MNARLIMIALVLTGALKVEGQPPRNLVPIATFGYPWDYASDVKVSDNIAYVATRQGLRVIDVSNPKLTHEIGYFYGENADWASNLQLKEDTCFVVFQNGLSILDISDPIYPTRIGHCPIATRIEKTGLALQGNFAYVTVLYSGLIALDISNPEMPDSVGFFETSDLAFDVAIAGNIAFVATYRAGITVLDISDPSNQELITVYDTPDAARRVAIDGDLLYVADLDAGLRVIDVSDPANPNEISAYDTRGRSCGISIENGIAALSDFDAIELFDIEDRGQLRSIGRFTGHDNARNIYLANSFAYYVSDDNGFAMVDLRNRPLQRDGICHTQGVPSKIAVANGMVYTAYGDVGLKILQIDEPLSEIGSFTLAREANGIGVVGNKAFITDRRRGLLSLDCSDPSDPVLVGELELNGTPSCMDVVEEVGVVVTDDIFLNIIDVSDPENLGLIESRQINGSINDVEIYQNMAIIALRDEGIQLWDLNQSVEISRCSTPGNANAISLFHNLAIIADGDSGITAVDLSNTRDPQVAWRFDIDGYTIDLCVSDSLIYVIDSIGVRVLDLIGETAEEVAFCALPGCLTLDAFENNIIVADWGKVMLIGYVPGQGITIKDALYSSLLSLSSYPNPFNSSTTISYSLPKPGRYALDVVDIQGRLVTRLADGWREAGSYREVLNGGQLTSGEYMIRLKGASETFARPITIIK